MADIRYFWIPDQGVDENGRPRNIYVADMKARTFEFTWLGGKEWTPTNPPFPFSRFQDEVARWVEYPGPTPMDTGLEVAEGL